LPERGGSDSHESTHNYGLVFHSLTSWALSLRLSDCDLEVNAEPEASANLEAIVFLGFRNLVVYYVACRERREVGIMYLDNI
jgi:hypothetical protein